jgi:hypothetical protein
MVDQQRKAPHGDVEDAELEDQDTEPHRRRSYFDWWLPAAGFGSGGSRAAALEQRILRDHQRQLDDFAKQISSGAYTAQSLVSEVWTFWSRSLGDQADRVRVAYGMKTRSDERNRDAPRVYAFTMAAGDESRTFTLRLDCDLLPIEDVALSATSLRSQEFKWEVAGDLIHFSPARVKRTPRAEQVVDITFAQAARGGNQRGPGFYVGTLSAGARPLGLLVLEVTDRNANVGR